jgi:glycosyltransferase involved in cell wall biosynthesis
MRPLSIVHVLSSFALGGQERVALALAGAQVTMGHRVHALSLAPPPDGELASDFAQRGVALHTVPKGAGVDLLLIARLAALFRRERLDVVHTHNPLPLFYGAPAGRLAACAVVHTKHGVNPDGGRRLWMRRVGGRLAHAYVAVSEATARVARERAECPEEQLRTIANGVELDTFGADACARTQARDELGIPRDAFVFGTIGRMSPEKDHALLVRAAAPLLGPSVRLVVVGDGSERPDVMAQARESAFVHLPGARRDVARLLAAFDVFVLSSWSEGLPLALVEAMATGLPIIATDVGGTKEVLAGTGLLVPPRDEVALRDAMRSVRASEDRARELGALARVRARHYDTRRMSDEYLALYASVMASTRTGEKS